MERTCRCWPGFLSIVWAHILLWLAPQSHGFPIDLENRMEDSHTQLLTGLVAVLLTICSVVFLAGCLCCPRKNGFKHDDKEFRDSAVVASSTSNLDQGHSNPVTGGEFTIFTPLSPPHHNNNVFHANQQIITKHLEDSVWFEDGQKDFPRTKLKYIRELGKGWFGKVVEGAANEDGDWKPVVVRILDATATPAERAVFLQDALIYRIQHPNVLGLMGRCLDHLPLLILQEFCPQGDLKRHLLDNATGILKTNFPLLWCSQVTSALKNLHDHGLIHPDLATRNCLLQPNLSLKLGDYGLAVQHYPEDYYQGSPSIPVRWTCPESLICTATTIQPKTMTQEGNIWSLGVLFWEIFECGAQPYHNLTDDEVISQVFGPANVRLAKPSNSVLYNDYIFRLMQMCWTSMASRPNIAQIDLILTDLLQVQKHSESSKDDFEERWQASKPNEIVRTDNELNNLPEANNKIDFILGPQTSLTQPQFTHQLDSLSDSISLKHRQSTSESETEDENWKKKVEQGAYSEKVRLKSRSVADLMVLTHVDYSESEPDSLDLRSVRFGSEGNLLNVQDSFEDELKKLQEERRDSLFFVPETSSILLQNLTEIQPESQVFNVFNVHVVHPLHEAKSLSKLHGGSDDSGLVSDFEPKPEDAQPKVFVVPKLYDLIQENDDLMNYIIDTYDEPKETNNEIKSAELTFDLSEDQQESMPNSLTHSSFNACLVDSDEPSSLNFFNKQDQNDLYSLETWGNFIDETMEKTSQDEEAGGWFLHPQGSEAAPDESYVGFGMDDDIMAAIRNELLMKLPHAQGSNETLEQEEQDKNEVFLRYNVYNTPLSPIPEESFAENGSESSDLSEEETSHQASNDTLFNLDDLKVEEEKNYLEEFLEHERRASVPVFVGPLPSPEDHPWKQLPASLVLKTVTHFEPEDEIIYEDYETLLLDDSDLGVLTDIRFSGPSDSQLMSTSFSLEEEDDEDHYWDSGSDTRSSSSGEFIWKEGEHEESLKALQAAPQNSSEPVLDEEQSTETSSSEDEETPEFVPSAWDKFAIPAKSALRSPEKIDQTKKAKGVWFKRQKYHCVYEYPREPDSPVLQSQDLWKLQPEFENCQDDEFFISNTATPFDNLSSQFFPGSQWSLGNCTPDSGVEDITPDVLTPQKNPDSLRNLAQATLMKSEINLKLGGLRHTKNFLKLDLPPSPSTFQDKPPTFSTFGKSRFSVQHVEEDQALNVSFEALPYKPILLNESVEFVRGEASLLDSADEDSGIESSTLERKIID